MQLKSLFTPLFFAATTGLSAQSVQQLKAQAEKAPSDTAKAGICLKIAQAEEAENPTEALQYAEKALAIYKSKNDAPGTALALLKVGDLKMKITSPFDARDTYLKALEITQNLNNPTLHADALIALSNSYRLAGDYTTAGEKAAEALKFAQNANNPALMCRALLQEGVVFADLGLQDRAEINYQKALPIARNNKLIKQELRILTNLAIGAARREDYTTAISRFRNAAERAKSLEQFSQLGNVYLNLGNTFLNMKAYDSSAYYSQLAQNIIAKYGDWFNWSIILANHGEALLGLKKYKEAEALALRSVDTAFAHQNVEMQYTAWELLSRIYESSGDIPKAYAAIKKTAVLKDSLDLESQRNSLKRQELKSEYEHKQAISKKESQLALQRQKWLRNIFILASCSMLLLVFVFWKQRSRIKTAKARSDELLLNILPEEIANELKETGEAQASLYENTTVLFTDFVGFTRVAEKMTPTQLVQEIHHCFSAFDSITSKHGLEKIKTVGDAYLAICGLPSANENHAIKSVAAALEIAEFMHAYQQQRSSQNMPYFEMRIGLHSGPVVAGVVGVKKFSYDIWGDTVNTAARMEENGVPGKVNISETTYNLLNGAFNTEYRGKIAAKNKGEMDMYFVSQK